MPIFFNKVTPVEHISQQQTKSFAEVVAELKRPQQAKTPAMFQPKQDTQVKREITQTKSFAEIVAGLKRPRQTKQVKQETTHSESIRQRLTEKPKRNKKTSAYMQDLMNK